MLEIRNLVKRYGKVSALDNLSLAISKGEIFGFVGPNGAGKTTTMKIICGLLSADSGDVIVDGINAHKNIKMLKGKIGYMPDFFGVYDNLKAIEYMEFYASIYGLSGMKARRRCMDLLALVQLEDQANSYVDDMSRGMKQRLCLARSIVHDPELVILDELASGLDPRARYEMKEILKELHKRGKTIVISSHILPELAQVCTHIGIIEKGKMVVKGTVDEILTMRGTSRPLVMKITDKQEYAIEILKQNKLVLNVTILDNSISVYFSGNEKEEAALLAEMVQNEVGVSSFAREDSDLETLFLQITQKEE